jgi:hypothetical protein
MHTKLRLTALGVILLGGGASVAEAEAGPTCENISLVVEFCPSAWQYCQALRPNCGVQWAGCGGTPATLVCLYWSDD